MDSYIPFLGILIIHANYYYPFISDDALISLRYASRLLSGDGLSWTEGRPVEGYSNLLWVLMIALLGWFHVDLIDAARLLGFCGMAIIMFSLSYCYIRQGELRRTVFPLIIALLFLALSAPVAVWTIGGLEQPLYAALIAISIVLMYHIIDTDGGCTPSFIALSLVLGLSCVTRPDGPLFTVAGVVALCAVGYLKASRVLLIRALWLPLIPIIFCAVQLLFRLYYYGEYVPNTAYVKVNPSWNHLEGGLYYLASGFESLFPFSMFAIVALAILLAMPNFRSRVLYLLLILLIWSVYIIFIGGDIFPAYRHHIPLIVVFSFLLVEGLKALFTVSRFPLLLKYRKSIMALLLVLFVPYTYSQFAREENHMAKLERWQWHCRDLALILKSAFVQQQPLMAVTAAGCMPYWSELPTVDMLGLNDHYLPRNPPDDFGSGPLAHELGEGQYVLDRNPGLIVFHTGILPLFRGGDELSVMPDFEHGYLPVFIRVSDVQLARVYINKYSADIGIKLSLSDIIIPGYLFRGDNAEVHFYDEKLVVQLTRDVPVQVTFDTDLDVDKVTSIIATYPHLVDSQLDWWQGELKLTLSTESEETIYIEQVTLE